MFFVRSVLHKTQEDIKEVRSLWRENNWTQEELLLMLQSRFGISEIKEIQTFNEEQFEQFKSALEKNNKN